MNRHLYLHSESESSWGKFFSSLKDRGLKKVDLVTSDDHKGLVNAVRRHFQGASWQLFQTHFSRNMLDHTPKALQPEIKEELRRLYEAVDLESAGKSMTRKLKTMNPEHQKLCFYWMRPLIT